MSATVTPTGHDCLVSALAAAQAEFEPILKDRDVNAGQKKYAYADLASVLASVRPALARNGIAIVQRTVVEGQDILLRTELRWRDDSIVSDIPLIADLRQPQAYGSALSYFRRYSILALVGAQPEMDDDDGEKATDHPPARSYHPRQEQRRPVYDSNNTRPPPPQNADTGEIVEMPARVVAAASDFWDRTSLRIPVKYDDRRRPDWQAWQGSLARAIEAAPTAGLLDKLKEDNGEQLAHLAIDVLPAANALLAKFENRAEELLDSCMVRDMGDEDQQEALPLPPASQALRDNVRAG